jgi:hypothetical protein
LKSVEEGRVDRLFREAESLLSQGKGREASLRFSRVLFGDPDNARARRGEDRARALLDEDERLAVQHLHEASAALREGRVDVAQVKVAAALHCGADPDLVQPLVDRLDERGGRMAVVTSSGPSTPSAGPGFGPSAGLSRSTLLTCFALFLAGLLFTVATSWERILGRLTEAPRPARSEAAPVTTLAAPSPGEKALLEARQFLATGEAQEAMRALDRISVQDPHWPYARRLRVEAEATLTRAGVAR